MAIKIPYTTEYGKATQMGGVENALTRFAIGVDTKVMNYEYVIDSDIQLVIITGYTDAEKDLPLWDHPIYLEYRKDKLLFVDLRRYVRPKDEQPTNIADIANNKDGIEFSIMHALLVADSIENDNGIHRVIFKPIATAFGTFLATISNSIIPLDIETKMKLEIVGVAHATRTMYEVEDYDALKQDIANRVLTTKYSIKLPKSTIIDTYNSLSPGASLDDLIYNMQMVSPEHISSLITKESLLGVMNNLWSGPGASETLIIGLESPATWIALVHSVIKNKSFKRSRLALILSKNGRNINVKLIEKHLTEYLSERTNII